jgi:ubiquinone biosynthesis protein
LKHGDDDSSQKRPSWRNLQRIAHIASVLSRHGWGRYLERLRLRGSEDAGARGPPDGVRHLRTALEDLGPTFVKFGQALSVRQDVFSDEVIRELQKLQDRVPPFPAEQARQVIERELEQPIRELFARFEDTPLAAASIAQVHAATLHDGTSVIVKVQRPGIGQTIRADLGILRFFARQVYRLIPESRRFDPVGLVEEFADVITKELDFLREGHNAERFRDLLEDESLIWVPGIHWGLSSARVLTMDRSGGSRIGPNTPADSDARRALAGALMRLFLTQVFEHGYFHGDPHPGNLFLLPDGRVCFHDFGIVGQLTTREQDNLRQLFLAIVARDADWMASIWLDMGGAPGEIDRVAFVRDLEQALDHFYAASTGEYSFGEMLQEFLRLGQRHQIKLLREIVLVAKAFMTIESLVRLLDADFNMITAFKDFAPRILITDLRFGRDVSVLPQMYRVFRSMGAVASGTPAALLGLVQMLQHGELRVRVQAEGLQEMERRLDRVGNRLSFSLIIAAVIIGSSLIMSFHAGVHYRGIPLLALLGYVIAGVLGLAWVIAILRSGRL